MMNHNGGPRPLNRRTTVRLLIAMTILVWATQTLMQQWGFGAQVPADAPAIAPAEELADEEALEEKFVPGTARFAAGAIIELRSEATVIGEDIRLRQIARWSKQDDPVLAPVGDLVLGRVGAATPFRAITVSEIKETLQAAGINIAAINFVGATSCTVNRSDVEYDERTALQQWIDAKQSATLEPATAPVGEALAAAAPAAAPLDPSETRSVLTLRDRLVMDLSQRLTLPRESLQISFRTQDERLLNLAEPLFRFEIEPVRVRNLGEVSWLVLIIANDGQDVQKATLTANARAWQDQLIVAKPLAMKQMIRDEDLIDRRALVERLPDEPLMARAEVVGQQAARPLAAGTVLTARAVEAIQLVKAGQYVTITLQQGAVNLKTVAKAMESGSYGQTIRVKNETTRDVFQVILTGPQTATMNLSWTQSNVANAGN